jgi:hypothetical protein
MKEMLFGTGRLLDHDIILELQLPLTSKRLDCLEKRTKGEAPVRVTTQVANEEQSNKKPALEIRTQGEVIQIIAIALLVG